MFGKSREQLADDVMETYLRWREACSAVKDAYAAWRSAGCGERRLACAAHLAALDREQHAAQVYAEAIERVMRLPPPAPGPERVAG